MSFTIQNFNSQGFTKFACEEKEEIKKIINNVKKLIVL